MVEFAGERVLCVLSHPDDETIGCGATLARAAREGAAVRVVLPFRRIDVAGRDDWDTVLRHMQRAAGLLGAQVVVDPDVGCESQFWQAPHRLLDSLTPQLEWATLVITHWHGDVHQAHRAVSQAVELGTRPFRRRRRVLQCEIPSSTDQSFVRTFVPNLFVPVAPNDADRKLQAMECYRSEHAPGRNPASLARWLNVRGEQIGVEQAEAFSVARWFL
jgi:LmbE family N-acetylglucosaminyl deacetylase